MADPDAILQAEKEKNAVLLSQNVNVDPSYINEYKRFVKWVKAQPELETQRAPFISRRNIDHYFSRVVVYRTGTQNTIGRIVSALQKCAQVFEHHVDFVVKSTDVVQALATQKALQSKRSTGKGGTDPHKGLKDILLERDKVRLMKHVYSTRKDWGECAINFTWGFQGAIRGASTRKFEFRDLYYSAGFGPEEEGPLSGSLLLVLRKGNRNKDRHDTDQQVCAWRHRNYMLCSVFATGAYLVMTLAHKHVHFLRSDSRNKDPDWWTIPLIEWNDYSGERIVLYCVSLILLTIPYVLQKHPIVPRPYIMQQGYIQVR